MSEARPVGSRLAKAGRGWPRLTEAGRGWPRLAEARGSLERDLRRAEGPAEGPAERLGPPLRPPCLPQVFTPLAIAVWVWVDADAPAAIAHSLSELFGLPLNPASTPPVGFHPISPGDALHGPSGLQLGKWLLL